MRKSSSTDQYDIDIFDVIIHKADINTKILDARNDNDRISIVTLSGDASVTAHYRLGVGINNAFLAIPEIGDLVRRLNEIGASNMFFKSKLQEINEAESQEKTAQVR